MIKQVMPWNLKIGQKLGQSDFDGKMKFHEITKIIKERSIFTGKSVWRVTTNNSLWPNSTFHGKGNRLPVTKATIKI